MMIDRTDRLSITRQANVLGISRCTVYALPTPISERDQRLMKRIDRLHLEMPFAGSRMLRGLLAQEGIKVGRKDVATLMERMSIEALYRKSRTTRKHRQHRGCPYLLRGLNKDHLQLFEAMQGIQSKAIGHAAAPPIHHCAERQTVDDFDVNATGASEFPQNRTTESTGRSIRTVAFKQGIRRRSEQTTFIKTLKPDDLP